MDSHATEPDTLLALLRLYSAEEMAAYPVSRDVNRPGNEGPSLIEPLVSGTGD